MNIKDTSNRIYKMSEREISKYINRLNKGNIEESIFIRPISNSVVVAKVWAEQPKITDRISWNIDSFRFFFIKNELNVYIGAILEMENDLHWYISPKYRKKGYLTTALKESIIPYLFKDDIESLKITIEKNAIGKKNYLNSKSVASNIGFKSINENETEFQLYKSDFDNSFKNIHEINIDIKMDRHETLRQRAFYAYKILYKISDELLMANNDDKELKEAAEIVRRFYI